MQQLNFPEYSFRLRKRENRNEIFDEVRKKWLVCTPEEWVRQHTLKWLIEEKGYPQSNIQIEGGLKLNQLQKRTDILCYKQGKPYLLVECKRPTVPITQKTFDQLFRYNGKINAPLLCVTNGMQNYFARFEQKNAELTYLMALPQY